MKKQWILLCASLLLFFGASALAQANVPEDFGKQYGLEFSSSRANAPISRGEALAVLTQVFPDYTWPQNLKMEDSNSVCQIEFLNCSVFIPRAALNQKSFLTWWSHLYTPELEFETPEERSLSTWYALRSQGLLPLMDEYVTYQDFQDILYRYQVSQAYSNIPYQKGMVVDLSEVSAQNYPLLKGVDDILVNLNQVESQFAANLTENQAQSLQQTHQRFTVLREELYEAKHPFNVVNHEMPDEIKQKITELNLNEVLASTTYATHKDSSNRRHNLLLGLERLSGKVYYPGEKVDFFQSLRELGFSDLTYSAIISGGQVVQGLGGGLCGSNTIAFQAALKAGLFRPGEEGSLRSPHSILYTELYPMGQDSVGFDAAVYFSYSRAHKNLTFINHFESPILLYNHYDAENQELTFYIFGNSPYQSVDLSEKAEKVGHNHYRIYQTITWPDGQEEVRSMDSYYSGIVH